MTINPDLPFVLISNCIPVKGAKRSAICDLTRSEIRLIPNDLYDILDLHEGKRVGEIKESYQNKHDAIIDEYFDFLVREEFILFTETPELFPKMDLQYHEPSDITNAILDISEYSSFDPIKVLKDLNEIGCKHVEIRFFRSTNVDELQPIVSMLNDIQASIISIDFIVPQSPGFCKENVIELLLQYPRIASFKIYNASTNEFIPPVDKQRGYIIYSDTILKDQRCCGVIDPSLFSVNIKTFTESLKYNSCLHRKVSIDHLGNIKNCPSMSKAFGNIKVDNTEEIISSTEFQQVWLVNKDSITTCKDCEFRYVCTDCRAYLENPEDLYSKPLKCGYDPYTNTWEPWANNPLKDKAKAYYNML
ncbi:grasp-with-spasm system SPASM domain peptide maturase [Aquimarina spongiae]|uniref:SPASM domain peptide maturase, grasp-with-spasm system n=1 Tax=Aquimarina spongiae TaxID=570521 RepID=A0A1M6JMG0_9FLAO|nr:grasp-with-spasm system SPASM domain peptide maturase [Aquimarina spongiae]SHJ47840.1 SPASM domain peptide maturase, grasp-with-spasm system [Aquimarina spongiae]